VNSENGDLRWYAVRAFWNKTDSLIREARDAGFETYYAVRTIDSVESGKLEYKQEPLIPSVFFVKCNLDWLVDFKFRHNSQLFLYRDKPGGKPAPIRDDEMKVFIMVTSAHNEKYQVEYLGEPKPKYVMGDRVRVTEGIYKGAEGVVVRIKKDRKLVVAISGVAVVAISHIPQCYLEKVDTK